MPRQLLLVQPQELIFRVEDGMPAYCTIRLSNNSRSEHVAFKIRTSDTNRFRATPSRGKITPRTSYEVRVTMLGQVEAPPNVGRRDKFSIESLIVNPDDGEESIWIQFNQQRHLVDVCKLKAVHIFPLPRQERNVQRIQDINRLQAGNQLQRGIVFVLSCLMFCYLVLQILSHIWSLISVITMLVLTAIRRMVLESAEDWIKRTLLYKCIFSISYASEAFINLFLSWLKDLLRDIGDLSRYLYSVVFGHNEIEHH